MAAPYNPPIKGEDFIFGIMLEDASNPGKFKTNPTIEAGDFKVITDDGAEANLATLPSVSPASSRRVKVTVSDSEMNGDNVLIAWQDQTDPPEWCAGAVSIPTQQ